jgi:hypothetical protein
LGRLEVGNYGKRVKNIEELEYYLNSKNPLIRTFYHSLAIMGI